MIALWVLAAVIGLTAGHGRFIEPPSRSSMWRFGFPNPPNYNDNELFCGGFTRQWQGNGGKCGVCGDPWDAPHPHPNEAGGKYANGIIVRTYNMGDIIEIKSELTAAHKGWFEYRMCVNNDVNKPITHECLDQHLLENADGSGTRWHLPAGAAAGIYTQRLRLPAGVKCSQCVIQWKYNTGNRWGTDPDGTSCTGCGPQEQFYGCADVTIV